MKKTIYMLVALAVMLTASVNASKVQNVSVQYNDGFTSAVISIDGPVRFTHQTEIAKDGKPFRVIVDILSATHELGSKNFMNLPNCPIKSIRTSQFSVTPEKVVRLVFDMDFDRVYRVDSDKNTLSLFFSDKSTAKFANWSSSNFVADKKKKTAPVKIASTQKTIEQKSSTKSVADLNKSINNDRLASLGDAASESKSQPKKVVTKPQPKFSQTVQFYGPEIDADELAINVEADKKAKAQALAKSDADKKAKAQALAKADADKKAKTQALAKANADKKAKAQALAKADADKKAKTQALAKANADKKAKTQALAKANADKKAKAQTLAKADADKKAKAQALAKADADKKAKAQKLAKAKADKKAKALKLAQADADKKAKALKLAKIEADKKKKSTSRFRRNPVSNKVRGTMVAQFPKRLVIKYKSRSYRDPFATLIDESKTYNNPVEKKIPNVEGLILVGIIQANQKSENRALFEDNDGYGYILKTGDKVRKGYVLRVNSDKVYFQIFEYGWSRTVALNLES